MPDISSRIAAIEESATLAVTNRAAELKAQGEPVIGFGAGEPDFPTADYIVDAAVEACRQAKWHRYTPAAGLPELGEAGQQRLLDSRVLVIGMGGLGSPVALYLAAAGVGHLVLSDYDWVDTSNLQRQIAHRAADIGEAKAASAARSR